MAVITTRPFSPDGSPFTGFLVLVNAKSQERKAIEVNQGNPTLEPVELAPGSYYAEWIQAEKEPKEDNLKVPDEAEVELSSVLASLKGDKIDKDAVQEAVGTPQAASDATLTAADPTVVAQPPSTEQEVSPVTTSTKRGGGASANA